MPMQDDLAESPDFDVKKVAEGGGCTRCGTPGDEILVYPYKPNANRYQCPNCGREWTW